LYQQFRIPVVLAALTDLKAPYVELINPLLTKRIIDQVRKLPDHLRTDKMLFKNIILTISPKIRFAKNVAIAPPEDILKSKQVLTLLRDELSSSHVNSFLPKEFINSVLRKIATIDDSRNTRRYTKYIKSHMPKWLKSKIRTVAKPEKQSIVLSFRVYMISQMKKIIREDILNLA
jgi:hypothetical protein